MATGADARDSSLAEDGRARRERPAWSAWAVLALCVAVWAPILAAMVEHWRIDADASHGFFVVPLALLFAWQRREDLRRTPVRGSWWGLPVLAAGTFLLAVGRLGAVLTLMRGAFVVTLIGLVLLLFGRRVARILAFPLLFLFLMVPLPASLVNVVAFPLQLLAAQAAVEALHVLQVPALLEGNIIHLAQTQLFVDEACSGLRSVMALLTLGVVFAWLFRTRLSERLIIVASTLPIAILVNAVRVAATGVLTHRYGEAAARGAIHEFQGMITFGLAFALLLLEARALDLVPWRRPARGRA